MGWINIKYSNLNSFSCAECGLYLMFIVVYIPNKIQSNGKYAIAIPGCPKRWIKTPNIFITKAVSMVPVVVLYTGLTTAVILGAAATVHLARTSMVTNVMAR